MWYQVWEAGTGMQLLILIIVTWTLNKELKTQAFFFFCIESSRQEQMNSLKKQLCYLKGTYICIIYNIRLYYIYLYIIINFTYYIYLYILYNVYKTEGLS